MPTFAFYDEEIEDLSICDFIVRVLNNKRNSMIEQYKKESFIESLKIATKEKRTKKRVETLTCNGDGLGIQKKITC